MKKYIAIFSVLALALAILVPTASAGVKIKFNNNDTDDGYFIGTGSSASQLYVSNHNNATVKIGTASLANSGGNTVLVGEDANIILIESDDASADSALATDVNTTLISYEVPAEGSVELEANDNTGDDSYYELTGNETESEVFENGNYVDYDQEAISDVNSGGNTAVVGEDLEGTATVRSGKAEATMTKGVSLNWFELHRTVVVSP